MSRCVLVEGSERTFTCVATACVFEGVTGPQKTCICQMNQIRLRIQPYHGLILVGFAKCPRHFVVIGRSFRYHNLNGLHALDAKPGVILSLQWWRAGVLDTKHKAQGVV